ncbi:MAG: prolyl-tRNA synthetase associated domain-containing protein [Deltaproteobacteria bacterium]|jgi:Ala-tRNA(Pro) deacylase|nr:prolyl-tRNA synthetase associated domain-containing protein [Deltaproteobacteria bacterium]
MTNEDRKRAVRDLFDELGIEYELVEHPPLFSREDNLKHSANLGAVIFKHLFLRNADKSRYYMYSLPLEKRADLSKLRAALGESRFSFAGEDELFDKLNIRPGSVSLLNAVGKPDADVTFLIDAEILGVERFAAHPNDNSATVIFSPREIPRIFDRRGAKHRFVES